MQRKKQPAFSLPELLKKGDWLDVKQKEGAYRLAKIILLEDKEVTIRFEDFDEYKRDCKLYVDSMRIAPLRRYTIGYTGPRYPNRDINLEIGKLPQIMTRMKNILELKEQNAYEITQFLRGRVYMIIEQTLSFPVDSLNKQQFKELVHFLQFFIKWSLDFNQKCIKISDGCLEEMITNKQSYLTNHNCAIVSSLAQVYYCIQLILTVKGELRNKLYKNLQDKQQRFRLFLVQLNGLQIIRKSFEFKDQNGRGFPAQIRIQALIILHYCKHKMVFSDFDVRDHIQLPKIFPTMLELYPGEKIENDIINYSLKLMSGQNNFQTRLKGLNELKSNLESVRSRDTQNIQFKKISEDRFLVLLKESRFFQNLLNKKTFNSEIFKRSVPLLKLLSEKKAFGSNEIKQIFTLAEDRHESDKRLIYDTISQIAAFSSTQILDGLWPELLKLPLDQPTTDLLQNFTIKAIHNIVSQSSIFDIFRKRKSSPKYDLYAVNYFWTQVQDSSKLFELNIIQYILSSLKVMLTHTSFNHARDTYIDKILTNLKSRTSIGQSLRLFIDIVMTYSPDSYLLGGDSRHDMIQKLDKKHKLLDLLFNALKAQKFGKMGYTLSIQYFFEFLQSFNDSLRTSLKINQIVSLWRTQYSLTPILAFLKKRKPTKQSDKQEYEDKYYKKLSDNLIKQLFDNIFLKPKSMNNYLLTDELFETVDELFLSMHISQKNIKFKDKSLIRVTSPTKQLDGISFYYNVIHFSSSPQAIVAKAIKRYIGLFLRTVQCDTQQLLNLWKLFLSKIEGNLEMEPSRGNQFMAVLYEFMQGIQGLLIRPNSIERSLVNITIHYKDQQKTVELSKQSSLFKLHQAIKQKYPQIKNFKMGLVETDKIITFTEEEDFSIKSLETKNNMVRIVEVQKEPFSEALFLFKNYISKSKIYDILLHLLNNQYVNQDQVWNLLDILPRNKTLLQKLNNPKQSQKQWPVFFNSKVQLLVYKLKLIQQLISNNDWLNNFVSGNGVKYLIQRILKNNIKDNQKYMKCEFLLINILLKCLNSKYGVPIIKILNNKQVVIKLVGIISNVIEEKDTKYSNLLLNSTLELVLIIIKSKTQLSNVLSQQKGFYEKLAVKGITFGGESRVFIQRFADLFQSYVSLQQQTSVVSQLIEILDKSRTHTIKFFDLLVICLNTINNPSFLLQSVQIVQIIKLFCKKVLNKSVEQNIQVAIDLQLYGVFKLKSILVNKSLIVEEQKVLLDSLITKYLLPVKGSVNLHLQISINQFYNLLLVLMSKHPEFCNIISVRLSQKLRLYQQSAIKYDWGVELQKQPRKKYCGLRNLRATCYINSLIQQLYMIQPFREALIRQPSSTYRQNPKQNQILQFQKVLTYLKQSKKGSYNPKQFLESFKDFDGNRIDVSIQGDVDQFYNALMQKLETFLKQNNAINIIDNVFSGKLSNQLICQSNHKSETFEHCTSVGLNIKNKSSLQQALQSYVQGQVLQGDNAYFCQKCKEKVKTVKRICIKTLPNVLIVVLKRFEFNYDTMKKYKVNDYCSFPFDLNMKKYTSEFLNQSKQFYPDQYYDFKLRGVIVHYGTSEAGHYYSYIKDKDDWFEFNDEVVSQFNPSSIQAETFGGTQTFGQDFEYKTERCKNAYVLFYQRSNSFDVKQNPTVQMINYPIVTEQQEFLHNLVLNDNSSYEFMSIVYDMKFLNFINYLLLSPSTGKLGLLVFHNIILKHRYKDDLIMGMGTKLQKILKQDKTLARWYINQFNKHIIREYLFESSTAIKYIITGLLCTSVQSAGDIEKRNIMMFLSFIESKGMTPFARIFTFIGLNQQNRKTLEDNNYKERVVQIIKNTSTYKQIEIQDWPTQLFETPLSQKPSDKPIKYIAFLQSLQNFDVPLQTLQSILPNMISTISINMIAKLAIKNCKTSENIQRLISAIQTSIIKGDDREVKQYIAWFKQLILIYCKQQTVSKVVQSYLNCFQSFYKTYIPFDTLLRGLFSLSKSSSLFRNQYQKQTTKDSLAIKLIETWIGKCGNAYHLIVSEDWTTYKSKSTGKSDTLTPSQYKQKKKQIQLLWQQLNSKKQPLPSESTQKIITTNQQFLQGPAQKLILCPKINAQKLVAKIQNKLGFLYQVSIQKSSCKWFTGDNDQLQFLSFI